MTDSEPVLCQQQTQDCPALMELERLRKEVRALQLQVILDPLTGLYNKRHFDQVLETEMERCRRSLQPMSLIILDLDHFKTINDGFGHATGDRVLRGAAQIFKRELRMIDIPCRYGGEEFVAILPATPLITAVQVAERLRGALKAHPLDSERSSLKVTASFGVSSFRPGQKITAEAFFERADQKLYEAKRAGRDAVYADIPESAPSVVSAGERAALLDDDADTRL